MNTTKYTRNDLFRWFLAANPGLDPKLAEEVFNEMSDQDLAGDFKVKILRPGVFYL